LHPRSGSGPRIGGLAEEAPLTFVDVTVLRRARCCPGTQALQYGYISSSQNSTKNRPAILSRLRTLRFNVAPHVVARRRCAPISVVAQDWVSRSSSARRWSDRRRDSPAAGSGQRRREYPEGKPLEFHVSSFWNVLNFHGVSLRRLSRAADAGTSGGPFLPAKL
jgi:hypothetical protein